MLYDAMRVIAVNRLKEFWDRNSGAEASLKHWHQIAKAATWKTTQDVQSSFSTAVVLNAERVRFEIAGGSYRLIVAFKFKSNIAFIKFIGTHAEYDKINALTVSQF